MKRLWLFALTLWFGFSCLAPAQVLHVEPVLRAVEQMYPPWLAALLERDVAAGRLRQARGQFDLNLLARGFTNPAGYYDGHGGEVLLEQPLSFWGGNVFAGYRISSGLLAEYDKDRTQEQGEIRAGLRLNLLRDGPIDRARADLWKARLDQRLVDPVLHRQRLDLRRAATKAYYQWATMGLRLRWTEALLKTAEERNGAVAEQVKNGLLPTIAQVDNERLVVSRRIALVQAQRRLEAAAIELSLFYRDADGEPILPTPQQLPRQFTLQPPPSEQSLGSTIRQALATRPETARIRLVQEKLKIDARLARNALLPSLSVSAALQQSSSDERYKTREPTEAQVGVEFKMPVQRNEAKGRQQTVQAELERLQLDEQFARERIVAEVRDAWSAWTAAWDQIQQTGRNLELAEKLEQADATRFREGATDLLTLQLREQATFDAHLLAVEAQAEYFRALADFEAAAALSSSRSSK